MSSTQSEMLLDDKNTNDSTPNTKTLNELKPNRKLSPIPFARFVDVEAIESDGDGGDVKNDDDDDFLWVDHEQNGMYYNNKINCSIHDP